MSPAKGREMQSSFDRSQPTHKLNKLNQLLMREKTQGSLLFSILQGESLGGGGGGGGMATSPELIEYWPSDE